MTFSGMWLSMHIVTNWTGDKSFRTDLPAGNSTSHPAAVVCDDPAAATPFCDAYCVLFYDVRLHTISCDIKNGRDPILPSRNELRQAEGTPYEEVE